MNTSKREPLQTQGILASLTSAFMWWAKVPVTFFVSCLWKQLNKPERSGAHGCMHRLVRTHVSCAQISWGPAPFVLRQDLGA